MPVHPFRLDDLAIDADQFFADVRPSFDRLPWDHYDQMRAQLDYLAGLDSTSAEAARRVDALSDDDERAAQLAQLIEGLAPEPRDHVKAILPFRRRTMNKYRLNRVEPGHWSVEPLDDHTIAQPVPDYRSRPRIFEPIDADVAGHPDVFRLLASGAETLHSFRPDLEATTVVLHQMTTLARSSQCGYPAPEGIHQDGADCIVSALVVERFGVSGGVSRVFEERGDRTLLEVELEPGEGICQADAGTNLWHDITPIHADQAEVGHRMTFGLDLHAD